MYSLPIGKNRAFLSNANGLTNAVLGGWQLGGSVQLQSGFPVGNFPDAFYRGGELSIPGYSMLDDSRVLRLETALDRLNAELAPLKEFILPGGSRPAAQAHIARTICRRAERSLVRLRREAPVHDVSLRYLNRLSDLLFVLARSLNRAAGGSDVLWQRTPPGDHETPA
jgi:cob(I)alamin adenosyltransferase